jgi:hypothetical protein
MSIQPIQSIQPSMPINKASEEIKINNLFNLKPKSLEQLLKNEKENDSEMTYILKRKYQLPKEIINLTYDKRNKIEFNANTKIILNFLQNSSKTKGADLSNIKKVEKFNVKDCKLTVTNYTDIPVRFDENRNLFIENQPLTTFTADDCQVIVYKRVGKPDSIYVANKDEANPNMGLENILAYRKDFNLWTPIQPEDMDWNMNMWNRSVF